MDEIKSTIVTPQSSIDHRPSKSSVDPPKIRIRQSAVRNRHEPLPLEARQSARGGGACVGARAKERRCGLVVGDRLRPTAEPFEDACRFEVGVAKDRCGTGPA